MAPPLDSLFAPKASIDPAAAKAAQDATLSDTFGSSPAPYNVDAAANAAIQQRIAAEALSLAPLMAKIRAGDIHDVRGQKQFALEQFRKAGASPGEAQAELERGMASTETFDQAVQRLDADRTAGQQPEQTKARGVPLSQLIGGQAGARVPVGAPRFATATTSTTNRTTQSARLDPEAAKQLGARAAEVAAERKAIEQQRAEQTADQNATVAKIQGDLRAEAERWAATLGRRGDVVHKQMSDADASLERMRSDLENIDTGPLGGMSATSKAILGIATALHSGAAAIGGRPDQSLKLIDTFVRQDLASQRARVHKRLAAMRLTGRQRDRAMQQWQQIEQDRRRAALRIGQLRIAEAGARAQSRAAKVNAATTINAIDSQLLAEDQRRAELATPRVVTATSSMSRRVPVGAGGGKGGVAKLAKEDEKRLDAAKDTARRLKQYIAQLNTERKKSGGTLASIKAGLPVVGSNTDAGAIAADRGDIVASLVFAKSGATATEPERKTQADRLPGFRDAPNVQRRKVANMVRPMVAALKDRVKSLVAQGRIAEARSFQSQIPEIEQLSGQVFTGIGGR